MSELRFNVKEVLPLLTQCSKVVLPKNSFPIFENIMFERKGDKLLATASDNEQWLSVKLPLLYGDMDNPFCINAKDFIEAMKNLGDIDVTLCFDEESHKVTCDYGSGHFQLPFVGADEFLRAKEEKEGVVEQIMGANNVLRMIEKTWFAIANDEPRPIMNGIHFDFFKDKVVSASSDGHKLAKCCDTSISHEEEVVYGFTMPSKTANVLKNILPSMGGEVKMAFNSGSLIISNSMFRLSSRLVDMRYPNYDAVIPKTHEATCDIDRKSLLGALKRVMPMGNITSELVSLTFKQGQCIISAEDIDFAKSASETLQCDYQGKDLTIGFKGSSLMQILSNLDGDNAVIELTDATKAAIIYDVNKEDYLSLLMPMLLN